MRSQMKIVPVLFLLYTPAFGDEFKAKCYVADGDTCRVSLRYQAIDAPEKKQLCQNAKGQCYPCGQLSKAALKVLMGKKLVRFKVWGYGKYGRPIVTAFDNDKDINLEMVRQGWVVVYRKYLPDEYKEAYLAAESEARSAGRGVWQGTFIMPRKWRRGDRLSCEKR